MRLLLVLESWGTGGTEQYVRSLYRALKRLDSDFEIGLLLLRDGARNGNLDGEDWIDELVTVHSWRSWRWSRMRSAIQGFHPDVCHLHLYSSTLLAAAAIKCTSRCRLLSTFHLPLSQWKRRHRQAFRIAVSMCDTVVGASELTANQLSAWRPDAITSSPSIEIREPDGPRDENGATHRSDHRFHVVGCGRLSAQKDWGTLVAAIAQIPRSTPITCEVIGAGELERELTDQINVFDCQDRVKLTGKLPHDETLRRIASADLFVLPSRFEGFGMAAVEAMSLGVPTITADFAASNEYLVDGETGNHFPIGDSRFLSNLILWHRSHRSESVELGLAGRRRVGDKYSPERGAKLHQQLYRCDHQSGV